MKQKWLFCRDAAKFKHNTIVFVVWVGSTACEKFCLKTIDLWAAQKGYFFRPYDEDTQYWLEQNSKTLRPSSKTPWLWVGRKDLDLMEFYNLVEDGIINGTEFDGTYSKDECKVLQIIDTEYFFSHTSNGKKGIAPGIRKNLSLCSQDERENLAVSAIILLLIFIADGYLNTILY